MTEVHHLVDSIPHNRLTFGAAEADAATRTVTSGWWASGAQGQMLEQALAEIAGRACGACVSSGVAALKLVLQAVGIGQGDRVIVPAYSCVAVPNAVLSLGAVPVAVDIDLQTYNLDPQKTRQTAGEGAGAKAIVAINTFGLPALIDDMIDLGIPVIEDCSHGIVQKRNAKTHIALSLGPTKYLASGGGGAVLTDDATIADSVRSERYYDGKVASGLRANDLLSDIHAAVALQQTTRLDAMIERRKVLADRYLDRLSQLAADTGVVLPHAADDHLWYRFVVRHPSVAVERTARLFSEAGVATASPVDNWLGDQVETYPVAHAAYSQAISLPLYPTLSDEEQDAVIAACSVALQN